jgi:hypothetical protein
MREDKNKKPGNKIRNISLIKLFITIRLFYDSECGTLSNISSHAIQDLTLYYAYVIISFKVTDYFNL